MILDEISKSFPKFNATERTLLIKFNSPAKEQNPGTYLKECITAVTDYPVNDVPGRDLVGLRIRNTENVEDKVVGISLRRRDHLKPDMVWAVLGKVIQSNARFGLSDRLEVHLDHMRMSAGNGGVRAKGRSLNVMSAIKKSIVTVKAAINCLAYALIIAMARVNGDPKYQSYRDGYGLKKIVEELFMASGVDLSNDRGFEELRQFQDHLSDYQIIVFHGLNPDRVMFSRNSRSATKLHVLYDRDNEHYNVITSLMGAMAKRYICNGCDTLYNKTHKCDKVCSLCTATPPCTKDPAKYCSTCNRRVLSEKCFQSFNSQSERQARLSVEKSIPKL